MRNCGISAEAVTLLATASAEFPALKRLDLGRNHLGPDCALALKAAFPAAAVDAA